MFLHDITGYMDNIYSETKIIIQIYDVVIKRLASYINAYQGRGY